VKNQDEIEYYSEDDESRKSKETNDGYLVGTVVWGKVVGHPKWPGMITYEPTSGKFRTETKHSYSYHVLFFGQPSTRSWISEVNITEMNETNFGEIAKTIQQNLSKRPEALKNFVVSLEQAENHLREFKNQKKYKFVHNLEPDEIDETKSNSNLCNICERLGATVYFLLLISFFSQTKLSKILKKIGGLSWGLSKSISFRMPQSKSKC